MILYNKRFKKKRESVFNPFFIVTYNGMHVLNHFISVKRNCFYFFKIITKLKIVNEAKTMRRNIIFKCKISSCSPYFIQNPGARYMTSVSMSSCFRIVEHIHAINLLYHQRSPDLSINEAAALN